MRVALETGCADGDFVGADPQVGKAEAAFRVGDACGGQVGLDMTRGDLRARDDRAGLDR